MKFCLAFILMFVTVLGFSQEKESKTIKEIIEVHEGIEEVPFAIVEKVPVYKGCDENNLNNLELRECMNKKIQEHIAKNFNTRKAAKGLKGIVTIYVLFKIDAEGNVIDLSIDAPTKKTKKETERVIKLIPQFERPGIVDGRPVIVPYALPIKFHVN